MNPSATSAPSVPPGLGHRPGHSLLADFGMDTITLSGTLEAKLEAVSQAGFSQIMLNARDLTEHPGGVAAAAQAVRASGLRVTGFQVLRDFEGLDGHLHQYKVDMAMSMLEMCAAVGSPLLLACSSTSRHAQGEPDAIARDLRKLAMLALPLGIKVAFEALSWGRFVNEYPASWDAVYRADMPNLGVCLDSFHVLAARTALDALDDIAPESIFLVQLADFMWHDAPTFEERMATARTFRVYPGEGVHSPQVSDFVLRLDRLGYCGDYSFEVFNDDYRQLPLEKVAQRARRSALWLRDDILRRAAPLPSWAHAT